jgi:hypothetical protein
MTSYHISTLYTTFGQFEGNTPEEAIAEFTYECGWDGTIEELEASEEMPDRFKEGHCPQCGAGDAFILDRDYVPYGDRDVAMDQWVLRCGECGAR